MTYAIIGAGAVGKALAKAFARKGIDVTLASRKSAAELAPLAESIGETVRAADLAEALTADFVILAVPFRANGEVASAITTWSGKTVVDAMNAFNVPQADYGNVLSSQAVAQALPGASLVKGFNHLPAQTLAADPQVGDAKRVIFLSGNDDSAIARVAELVANLGFAPVSLGPLAAGGTALHAQGSKWGPLSFQDVLRKG